MSGQEPEDQRLTKELRHIANFETAHQIKPMHLSRPHANLQMVRDFPIRQSLRNETQNFQLSRGEQMSAPPSPLLPICTRSAPLNSVSVQGISPLL